MSLTTDRASCLGCGASHHLAPGVYACRCARRENLSVDYRLDAARRQALLDALAGNESSLWRYAPLLPVDPRFRTRLSVGWTPLCDCGEVMGARLFLKDETRNPSGSLKDRASEVVAAVAAAHGIGHVIVASTGNAAASLACIGAAAGIRVTILVPATIPPAKLAQSLAYGAAVYRVAGTYDDACALAAQVSAAAGIFNRSTGLNPFTREGKKSCAFEIAEQLNWQVPDWVIVPTGDGNILSAIGKGFQELQALGMIDALPRLVAAQSAASSVIARSFGSSDAAADSGRATKTVCAKTLADSITVGVPADRTAALAALAASQGLAVEVEDEAIVAGVRALASRFGVFVEPSSAAAFAAFEHLRRSGRIEAHHRVVCLATGSGLKDLRPVLRPDNLAALPLIAPGAWRDVAA